MKFFKNIIEIFAGILAGYHIGKYASYFFYFIAFFPQVIYNFDGGGGSPAPIYLFFLSFPIGFIVAIIILSINLVLLAFLPKIGVISSTISLIMGCYLCVAIVLNILSGNTIHLPLLF